LAELTKGDVDGPVNRAAPELFFLANVQQKGIGVRKFAPSRQVNVAPQDVCRYHAGQVHGIFGRAKLGRITQFGFFQIEDGGAPLDGERYDVDPAFHTLLADGLSA
jgi:hypothetical protein